MTMVTGQKNYITPEGYAALKTEFDQLFKVERPEVVKTVSWAAGNGDRSENGDYIYGKRRLRQIDSRCRYLLKRMENAEVVNAGDQQHLDKVFFGAWVTLYNIDDESEKTYRIVGKDELDPKKGYISWVSPMAKALRGKGEGDVIHLETPNGVNELEVIEVRY